MEAAAAVEFVGLVRERFINEPSKFHEFAKCLRDLNSAAMQDRDFLVSKIKNLFLDDDHQDLLLGLDDFLPRNMVFEREDDDNNKYSLLLSDSSASKFFNKIRDRCVEKDDKEFSVLIKFCELILSCHERRITAKEADKELGVLFKGDVDLYIESTHFLADLWTEQESNEQPGLDYSSVRFLNKRRKVVRKPSLYDKTMAVKEFYLDEMELVLVRMKSTSKKLDGDPQSFGECFSVHDSKCVVQLYKGSGSHSDYSYEGQELLEILRSDPVARGVVQERLREKMMQLEEHKLCLDRVWREIFEDIKDKGDVCRHTDFLQQMTELSKTDYLT